MKESVYFLEIQLENVKCFKERVTLSISDNKQDWKRWTVILGDNGLGKTTLLQAIASLEIRKRIDGKNNNSYSYSYRSGIPITRNYSENKLIIEALITKNYLPEDQQTNSRKDLSVEAYTKSINSWTSRNGGSFYTSKAKEKFAMDIYSYGANRVMGSTSLSDTLSDDNSETLFDDNKKLINAEEWLLQLDYAASKESNVKSFAESKRDQVKQILIDLLPDVDTIRFTNPSRTNLKSSIEFNTSFGWLGIHELSLGYRTMIAWMVDLAARMFARNLESNNPLAEPAIVLVDEIDLHLHPKWQRKIFQHLSTQFPNTQFIVTAHSPLIVQSAPNDANIVLLKKEGDHVIIENDIKSVHNWRLDQIMSSDLFDEGGRNSDIEKWLNERKILLQRDKLTPEEEERLIELNKKASELPTADNPLDIEAMDVIRKAADFLKNKRQ